MEGGIGQTLDGIHTSWLITENLRRKARLPTFSRGEHGANASERRLDHSSSEVAIMELDWPTAFTIVGVVWAICWALRAMEGK